MMLSNSRVAACTLAVVCSFALSQSVQAQCACGGASLGMPMGSMSPGSSMLPGGDPLQPGMIIEPNAIYLTIQVPEETLPLTINGDPTISIGPTRYFVVRGLEPDREYEFDIVAERANAAQVVMMERKKLVLKTGAIETVTLKPVRRKTDVLEEEQKKQAEEAKLVSTGARQ